MNWEGEAVAVSLRLVNEGPAPVEILDVGFKGEQGITGELLGVSDCPGGCPGAINLSTADKLGMLDGLDAPPFTLIPEVRRQREGLVLISLIVTANFDGPPAARCCSIHGIVLTTADGHTVTARGPEPWVLRLADESIAE